jgi:RNA polymerase primary sigma factor
VSRLDKVIDTDGTTLFDVIEDVNSEQPDAGILLEKSVLMSKINDIMVIHLSDVERDVVTWYFGFDGEPLTLQEISENLELTRERVRQIKEKALKKLRNHSAELFDLL